MKKVQLKAKQNQAAAGTEPPTPIDMSEYITFTDAERDAMMSLPNKSYLLDSGKKAIDVVEKEIYLGLIDIVYGNSMAYTSLLL